ncbi:MAG: hypothetical protein AAGC63_01900 [Propionicimonas sp.]|nr:hypothetical protein [Propionicimonas sp.]
MKTMQETRIGVGGGWPGAVGETTPGHGTITGRLRVREGELEGYPVDRPLVGVEVVLAVSEGAGGPWSQLRSTRTDASGSFSLTRDGASSGRFLQVRVRLAGPDLTIEDGRAAGSPGHGPAGQGWQTIWSSGDPRPAGDVVTGDRLVAPGEPDDLGSPVFRRQAVLWYLLRTVLDRLRAEDGWFGLDHRVTVVHPARDAAAGSRRFGERIQLADGGPQWRPETVLPYFWGCWYELHARRSGHRGGDGPGAAFAEGFARFATTTVLHELWDRRLDRPANRHYLAAGLAVGTLAELERDPAAVSRALHLLRFGGRQGWWSHLYGTAQSYPLDRPDEDGDGSPDHPAETGVMERLDGRVLPAGPHHLSFWEILRSFRADAAHGWATDLDAGGANGLLRFLDRTVDIHCLGEDVRTMLRGSIDPRATVEPYELLPSAG